MSEVNDQNACCDVNSDKDYFFLWLENELKKLVTCKWFSSYSWNITLLHSRHQPHYLLVLSNTTCTELVHGKLFWTFIGEEYFLFAVIEVIPVMF